MAGLLRDRCCVLGPRRAAAGRGRRRPPDRLADGRRHRRRRLRRRPASAGRRGARGQPARRGRELRADPPGPVPLDLAGRDRRCDRRGDRGRGPAPTTSSSLAAGPTRGSSRRRSSTPGRAARARSTLFPIADLEDPSLHVRPAVPVMAGVGAGGASPAGRAPAAAAVDALLRPRPVHPSVLIAERIADRARRVYGLKHTLSAPLTTDARRHRCDRRLAPDCRGVAGVGAADPRPGPRSRHRRRCRGPTRIARPRRAPRPTRSPGSRIGATSTSSARCSPGAAGPRTRSASSWSTSTGSSC